MMSSPTRPPLCAALAPSPRASPRRPTTTKPELAPYPAVPTGETHALAAAFAEMVAVAAELLQLRGTFATRMSDVRTESARSASPAVRGPVINVDDIQRMMTRNGVRLTKREFSESAAVLAEGRADLDKSSVVYRTIGLDTPLRVVAEGRLDRSQLSVSDERDFCTLLKQQIRCLSQLGDIRQRLHILKIDPTRILDMVHTYRHDLSSVFGTERPAEKGTLCVSHIRDFLITHDIYVSTKEILVMVEMLAGYPSGKIYLSDIVAVLGLRSS